MIEYACPQCGESMNSPDSMVGQAETCPACGNVTLVPDGTVRKCPISTQPPNRETSATEQRGNSIFNRDRLLLIFAAVFIFGAAMLIGGLCVRSQDRTYYNAARATTVMGAAFDAVDADRAGTLTVSYATAEREALKDAGLEEFQASGTSWGLIIIGSLAIMTSVLFFVGVAIIRFAPVSERAPRTGIEQTARN